VEEARRDAGLTADEFRAWLEQNHATASEIEVVFYKKGSGKPSMTWSESVDEALSFGWIDGVRRGRDEESYTIRFTPRKPRSTWSKVNVEKAQRLIAHGLMRPAGLAAFERRTDDNTGVYSFENETELAPEYEARLRANKAAADYFESRPPWYRRTAIHLVMSAKREETRERRLEQLIEDSAASRDIKQLRR
jgi:uncharacterized protein YdeI (YjbR/CyaY-like superfamily)